MLKILRFLRSSSDCISMMGLNGRICCFTFGVSVFLWNEKYTPNPIHTVAASRPNTRIYSKSLRLMSDESFDMFWFIFFPSSTFSRAISLLPLEQLHNMRLSVSPLLAKEDFFE